MILIIVSIISQYNESLDLVKQTWFPCIYFLCKVTVYRSKQKTMWDNKTQDSQK